MTDNLMFLLVNAVILLANLATLGLVLKLYTEFFKQAVQGGRR